MSQDFMLRLAGNPPKEEPDFSVSCPIPSGEKVPCVDPRALRGWLLLMDMYAALGGAASHWGGPSAFAEIVSVVYGWVFHEARKQNKPWFELLHLVNDAGHCENVHYALKAAYGFAGLEIPSLWKFRSLESVLTGHGEAHLFPQGVLLSNGPLGSAFPQSEGLALGDALKGRWDRVTVTFISDGAMMEGETREALASIPGFAAKGKLAPFVLILSDNNTKLSGRIDLESFSMQPSFEALKTLGWRVILEPCGNDLNSCMSSWLRSYESAINDPSQPVCLWIKTVKGYGLQKTMESPSGGHGFPFKKVNELLPALKEIFAPDEVPSAFQSWFNELVTFEQQRVAKSQQKNVTAELGLGPQGKIQEGVTRALVWAKEQGYPVVSITSDLPGSTGVQGFRQKFPECALDVGVAEANMISVGMGLSYQGFIPVVDTFAQFGTTKGCLPFLMGGLSRLGVIAFFSHIGFQDAADGASHQSLNYLALTLGLPKAEVFSLASEEEAFLCTKLAIQEFGEALSSQKIPQSYIFFMGRENFPKNYGLEGLVTDLRKPWIAYSPHSPLKAVVISIGTLLPESIKAAKILDENGLGVIVVHPRVLNRWDREFYSSLLKKTGGRVVFVEDHQRIHGFSSFLISEWLQEQMMVKPRVLGVRGDYGRSAYTALDLYREYALDAQSISQATRSLIETTE